MRLATCLAFVLATAIELPAAPGDGTKEVLARARRYVADYDRQLIAVIADEHYLQATRTTTTDHDLGGSRERALDSEFGWISLPALHETIGVRDVLRVDGRTVADGFRLRALLAHPQQDPSREIRAILAESARHNIGSLERNFNFPTFPLVYIRRGPDSGMRWRADRAGSAGVLGFDERERSTIVRTIDGKPTRATGRFRIDWESGRVLACDIRLQVPLPPVSFPQEYRIWVEFAHDERLDLWVPARMIEHFGRAGGADFSDSGVRGDATYRNYRRYETAGRMLPP